MFQFSRVLYSLHSDIRKSIENIAKKWNTSKSLDDQVKVVLECINKRDYLTVYQLGVGSSVDIDVRILQALMKGI